MQSIPAVISANPASDDVTTLMLANPAKELDMLRVQPPLAKLTGQSLDAPGELAVKGVTARHYDLVATFRGLTNLTVAEREALSLNVHIFTALPGSSGSAWRGPVVSWGGDATAAAPVPEDDGLRPAAPPACTWQFKNHLSCNNTDIQSKDLKGEGVRLPANTTDEAGIAACIAACEKVSVCLSVSLSLCLSV